VCLFNQLLGISFLASASWHQQLSHYMRHPQ
jgi:hypothetical protein